MTVTLREVTQEDLPIFFEDQLDAEATRMAAFPSRDRNAFMAHWLRIMGKETNASGILNTILVDDTDDTSDDEKRVPVLNCANLTTGRK